MPQYIVIAGAAPALNRTAVEKIDDQNSVIRTKHVQHGQILDESYFREGEIGDALRGGFIEEYRPHTLTAEDIKAHAKDARCIGWPDGEGGTVIPWKEGAVIHAGTKGFKPAKKEEKKAAEAKK